MRRKWYLIAPLATLAMLLFVFVGGQVVVHLWNWLLPGLFGWHQIGFWQAIGLLVLCRILFGGLGFRGHGRSHLRRRWEERRENMTPEERERFRVGMRAHCHFGAPATETKEP